MGWTSAVVLVAVTSTSVAARGPITSSALREVERLARDEQHVSPLSDWSRVQRVTPGTPVIVAMKAAPPAPRIFVSADASRLVLLNLSDPALPGSVVRALMAAVAVHPDDFSTSPTSRELIVGKVRIGPYAISKDGRRIVGIDAVIERFDAADISTVKLLRRTPASIAAVVGGIAGGFAAGYFAFLSTMDCPYVRNCGGWQLKQWSLLWAPIAGGLLGYWATREQIEETIYKRPENAAPPNAVSDWTPRLAASRQ